MQAVKPGIELSGIEIDRASGRWRQFVFGSNPVHTLRRVVIWSAVTILFFHKLLVPIEVVGSSMTPTYRNGSYNFVNRWSYSVDKPKRGDVIAVHADGELLLKRIVALPGEKVEITRGKLLVNGHPLSDAFANIDIPWEMDPIRLKASEYFVIGDNRSATVFGAVEKGQIMGKVVF